MPVQLDRYDNSWYKPGRSAFVRLLWLLVSALFVQCRWHPVSSVRVFLLRLFGAKVGKGVMIKPGVQVKYPWHLSVGDYTWIGEHVWIDNLTKVEIGNHVCLSQGAYLLTGNHDYKTSTFDLMVAGIVLEDGVWIGAKSIVCPGVRAASHAVLTAGSVATKELTAYMIHSGNPAVALKERTMQNA